MINQSEIDELRALFEKAVKENSPEATHLLVEEALLGVMLSGFMEEGATLNIDFSAMSSKATMLAGDITRQTQP